MPYDERVSESRRTQRTFTSRLSDDERLDLWEAAIRKSQEDRNRTPLHYAIFNLRRSIANRLGVLPIVILHDGVFLYLRKNKPIEKPEPHAESRSTGLLLGDRLSRLA